MSKEKFSAENGFVPGVVVEIVFNRNVAHFGPGKAYLFRFKGYSEYEIVILEENNGNELQPYPGEINSIRILSGPFSVWQCSPPQAETHHRALSEDMFSAQNRSSWFGQLDDLTDETVNDLQEKGIITNKSFCITHRPWWAINNPQKS
jgi:hypothetical protein